MDVGFIGLGRMGEAMAVNLARAGHRVRAWNRSAVAAGTVPGVTIVASPAEALAGDAAITMLADDAAIEEVLVAPGLLAQADKALVHVVTSTISVAFSDQLAELHAAHGLAYVAAPVFGRPDAAAAAQLHIVVAGPAEAIDRVQPLFDAIGQRTWRMGERQPQASAAKVAGNMMLTMAIEAMAEALVLTGVEGVEDRAFLDLMLGTLFGARAYQSYAGNILEERYDPPGFVMRLGLKDLRLAAEAGAGRALPMLAAVRAQMTAAADSGLADKDWSAMAAYTLRQRE